MKTRQKKQEEEKEGKELPLLCTVYCLFNINKKHSMLVQDLRMRSKNINKNIFLRSKLEGMEQTFVLNLINYNLFFNKIKV